MRWELTLFLAHSLFPRPNMEGFLAPLLRLPWFRFGTMPDWIRFRLITGLPPAQAEQIRDLLERLLYNSLFRSASGFTLEVVRQPLAAWQRAALRAALRVGQFGRKPIPGVAQDRVLVSFLLGRNLKPGELRYPGGVIGSLRRAWRAPLPERTAPPSRPARFLAMLFRVAITAAGIYGSFVCAVDGSSSPTLLSSLVGPIFGTVVLLWRLPIKALFSLRSVLFLSLSTAVWVIVNWVMSREDSPLQFRIAVLLGSLLLPVAHAWVLKAPWARVRLAIPLAYAAFELGIPVFQALEDRNWETIQYVVNYCGFWQFAYLLAMVGPRIGFLSRFDDWLMSTVTGRGHRTARKDSPARDRPTAV
jgi:hypothetical protein